MRRFAALVLVPALLACAPPAAAAERSAGVRSSADARSSARSARSKPGAPKARCAGHRSTRLRGAARHRACARFGHGRLIGTARTALTGAPAAFGVPAPFAAPAPPAPAAAAPGAAPAPAAGPAPTAPTLPPVFSDPRALQVQAFEFGLQLSKATVRSGDVRVEFNSARAEDPHNLLLVRSDGSGPVLRFDEQPAGAVASRTLPLTTGRWTLFCSLTGHEAAGMRATLNVAD